MLIGTRSLQIIDHGIEKELKVSVFSPVETEGSWTCRYQIDWPEETLVRDVGGIDALQAILLAFYMVGSDLYFSIANREGRLMFAGVKGQLGFPLHASIREGAVGYEDI
jgi:hypothetical protein